MSGELSDRWKLAKLAKLAKPADPRPRCLHRNGQRKVTYRSRAKARQAAVLLRGGNRRVGSVDVVLRPYQCGRCGGWHLTSKGES